MTRGAAAGSRYLLGIAGIRRIMGEFGFSYEQIVEKFFVDFGALFHVLEEMPDCVVKGGMAVPFHIADPFDRRLSVDVDVVTRRPRDEVERRMGRIRENASGFMRIGGAHRPARAAKNLPLLTYYTGYGPSVADGADIKIEVFHDYGLDMASEMISPPFDMFGVDVDFPLEVYGKESLIGDKLVTLAFGTVGIPAWRRLDVPKQVYDIAVLARAAGQSLDMGCVARAFEQVSRYEAEHLGMRGLSPEDVAYDAAGFHERLLSGPDARLLDPSYGGHLDYFATRFLGSKRYKGHHYVSDMLLARTLAALSGRCMGGMGHAEATSTMRGILSRLDSIYAMTDSEQAAFRRELIRGGAAGGPPGVPLGDIPADQVLLYDAARRLGA